MRIRKNTILLITNELLRMEEDCAHSAKSHFNASARWLKWHYIFGVPTIVLATLAGTAFFKDYPFFAGLMTSVVAMFSALVTFLKPSELSANHKSSGDQYLSLRNDSRVFRTIELQRISDEDAAIGATASLTTRRNELNAASPIFSNGDFQKARTGIEVGEAKHEVDK